MADKHVEEIHVTETTPQGTQEQGVERGHEEGDINIRAVMVWFRSLAIMAILSILAMWGMFAALSKIQEGKDVLPSPLFAGKSQPPAPEPRLLPEPWEAMAKEKRKEDVKIEKYGLADEKGDPRLPENAVNLVPDAQATGDRTTWQSMEVMPSDASGGTVMEKRQE